MKIYLLDVDNTIARIQPTAELYKKLFLRNSQIKYFLIGYGMVFLLKLFWFIPIVVSLQRKFIMTLFSQVKKEIIEHESDVIARQTAKLFKADFESIFFKEKRKGDLVFLLTHCPEPIARRLNTLLGFDGYFSVPIQDYFSSSRQGYILSKNEVIQDFRAKYPNSNIMYFADDLIDLSSLLLADMGYLVNGSKLTKLYCRIFHKRDITLVN